MQRKKRLIIISVIVVCLALIILLSSTVFTLKYASVECRTTTLILTETDYDSIIDSGNFKYGKNILFLNFKDSVKNIEKEHPYVKVINIERKFPNYAVINIEERVPAVRLKSSDGYFVVDTDLKVLNRVTEASEYVEITKEQFVPRLSFADLPEFKYNTDCAKGDFLSSELIRNFTTAIFDGLVTKDGDSEIPINCLSVVEYINVSYESAVAGGIYKFDLKFSDSATTATIYNADDLTDRFYNILQLYLKYQTRFSNYKVTPQGNYTGDGGNIN